ncbi:GntR family transcriptional regulator [Embleya sp. NPDC056575]|uniref:GntR family transcriptional regulator n=1 Tax=unclassified Embleya TaxID=2699296 RepID=UPI003676D021
MAGVPHGETPAYMRVANALRERIQAGEFPPGSRIPSRAEITATYRVGNTSALEALRVLTSEGLVEGRQGSGTYVRARRAEVHLVRHWTEDIGHRMPYTMAMAERPDASPTWTVNTETHAAAPENIAHRLDIAPNDRCVRSVYLFRIDGDVVMWHSSWEPYAITAGTPILLPERGPLAGAGVPARMAAIGHVITHTIEDLTARPALAEEARVLEVQTGTSLLVIRRTWRTDAGPVETADILIPGGMNEVRYELPVRDPGAQRQETPRDATGISGTPEGRN